MKKKKIYKIPTDRVSQLPTDIHFDPDLIAELSVGKEWKGTGETWSATGTASTELSMDTKVFGAIDGIERLKDTDEMRFKFMNMEFTVPFNEEAFAVLHNSFTNRTPVEIEYRL